MIGGDYNETHDQTAIIQMEQHFVTLYELKEALVGSTKKYHDFTTFKYRKKEGYVKRTIDYIFLAKNNWYKANQNQVRITHSLEMPEENLIDQKMANPCKDHPSDHYSIAYTIEL